MTIHRAAVLLTAVIGLLFAGGTAAEPSAPSAAVPVSQTGASKSFTMLSITVTNPGSGYTSAPTVTITPSAGMHMNVRAMAIVADGKVASVFIASGGSGYSPASPPTVTFSGGGGSGAAATATVVDKQDDYYWTAKGVGAPSPSPRFTDNKDGTVTDNKTGLIWLANANGFGEVTWTQAMADCSSLASGSYGLTDGSKAGEWRLPNVNELRSLCNYGFRPSLPNDKGDAPWGKGASSILSFQTANGYWTSTAFLSKPGRAWAVNMGFGMANDIVSHRNDHMQPYLMNVWPVRGKGTSSVSATGANVSFTALSIMVTNPGSGYTSAPIVTVSAPAAGTAAIAQSTFGGVSSIKITNGGSGYTSVPTVTFSGGKGSKAEAYATISGGVVTGITVANGGAYTVAPDVTITTSAAGVAATATATLSADTVGSIVVTYGGSGYLPSAPPTVAISGGGGSGAVATATVITDHDDFYWATQGVGAPLPSPQFSNNKDGTVTDNKTGLVWLANADAFGEVPADQALTECNKLASGSHGLSDGSKPGDWRLPNVNELQSLANYGYLNPMITNDKGDAKWTPDAVGTTCSIAGVQSGWYWTSTTTVLSSDRIWAINLGTGTIHFEPSMTDHVWPVRGGK